MNANTHCHDFVQYIQRLIVKNKGGVTAALKRSLQDEAESKLAAYPYVVPLLSPEAKYRKNDWAYFLVAGLLAVHPKHSDSETMKNLGDTCRMLGGENENPTASWVLRFKALLDAEQDDIAHHLRSIISIAKAKEIPVNYTQLLQDLLRWSKPEKTAQQFMAMRFWCSLSQSEAADSETV